MRVFAAFAFLVRVWPEVLKAVSCRTGIAVAAAPMAMNCPMLPCPFCFLAVGHDAAQGDIAQALQRCEDQRACGRLTEFQFGMFRNAAAEALYSRGLVSSPRAALNLVARLESTPIGDIVAAPPAPSTAPPPAPPQPSDMADNIADNSDWGELQFCIPCQMWLRSVPQLRDHKRGRKHRRNRLAQKLTDAGLLPIEVPEVVAKKIAQFVI